MKSNQMLNKMQSAPMEAYQQIYNDIPVYIFEMARHASAQCLAEGIKDKQEPDDIYKNIFVTGYIAAKLSQKIELNDLMHQN